jgi:hypothetical protein
MATAAFKGLQNFEKDNNISKEDFFDNNSVANNFIYEVTKAFIETNAQNVNFCLFFFFK